MRGRRQRLECAANLPFDAFAQAVEVFSEPAGAAGGGGKDSGQHVVAVFACVHIPGDFHNFGHEPVRRCVWQWVVRAVMQCVVLQCDACVSV